MKHYFLITGIIVVSVYCKAQLNKDQSSLDKKTIEVVIQNFKDPKNNSVLVIAHRGDWRNAPENSIQAIQNCIDMGVDAVELDLSMTKDGHIVLIHDETLNRTTTGKGVVKDWTLDSLKMLYLKNGAGYITHHKIPTFTEALRVAKDHILIDLDIKASIPFEKIYQELVAENMVDQVFTISYRSLEEAKKYYGKYLDKVLYFPAISKDIEDISAYIDEFETSINPFVYVPKFETDTSYIVNYLDTITANHDKIWIHTISADRSGGHHDDRAVYDLEGSYGWLIEKGVDMMQTDRPQLLIEYLRKKGLHK